MLVFQTDADAAARARRPPRPTSSSAASGAPSGTRRARRPSPWTAARSASSPRRPGSRSTSRARPRPCSPPPSAPRRAARPAVAHRREPEALDRRRRRRWGSPGVVGTYETIYGGIANRIHNVQLVAHLIDGKLIAPGATFSFNDATGERTAAKGFLEAPVIINGELSTGLGGGICQVSTTVFNAAYEAGLPITARTNHALYISHYPLGRDATVNYPDIDLKFVNDTEHWLLLRTFVGSSSLVVNLYGAPQHRRVDTETAPLRVVAPAPVDRSRRRDARARLESRRRRTAFRRRRPRCTGASTRRTASCSPTRPGPRTTSAEPTIVRLGPKKVPKPKPKPKPAKPAPDGGAGHADDAGGEAAAVAIASTSQPGRRVGRSVVASTVRVRGPAVGDRASRRASTTYSKRKRAPRHGVAAGVHEQPVVEHAPAAGSARATRARTTRSPRRAAAGSRPRGARGTSTRATSNQTK